MTTKPTPPVVPLTVNETIAFIGNEGLKYGQTSHVKVKRHQTYADFEVRVDARPSLAFSVSHYVMTSPVSCKEYISLVMQRYFKP